jgi:hypothetical protein
MEDETFLEPAKVYPTMLWERFSTATKSVWDHVYKKIIAAAFFS